MFSSHDNFFSFSCLIVTVFTPILMWRSFAIDSAVMNGYGAFVVIANGKDINRERSRGSGHWSTGAELERVVIIEVVSIVI
jgi:hypothetical protein